MFRRRLHNLGNLPWIVLAVIGGVGAISLKATNNDGWGILAALVLGIVGITWGIVSSVRSERVHKTNREFAKLHGWDYAARSHEFNHRFSGFPFGQGHARRQEAVLRGTFNGQECASFAHVFETGRGHDGQPGDQHAFQVTLAELPVALPRIDIVPENLPGYIAKALGGGDVDVESYEFNQRWRVIANDPQYAHALLDPRMVERFLYADVEGLGVRIDGGAVYAWSVGRRGVDNLARRLGVVSGIARRIPDHVVRQYKDLGYHVHQGGAATKPLSGPAWALEPGALTSRSYTGIGMDSSGDGKKDREQRR